MMTSLIRGTLRYHDGCMWVDGPQGEGQRLLLFSRGWSANRVDGVVRLTSPRGRTFETGSEFEGDGGDDPLDFAMSGDLDAVPAACRTDVAFIVNP